VKNSPSRMLMDVQRAHGSGAGAEFFDGIAGFYGN